MEFEGRRRIALDPTGVGAALRSPAALAAGIAQCESLQAVGRDRYEVVLRFALGSECARFVGVLQVQAVQLPLRWQLRLEGNAGNAGFGVGWLALELQPRAGGHSCVRYHASVDVGGVQAQMAPDAVEEALRALIDGFIAGLDVPARSGTRRGARARWGWVLPAALLLAGVYLGMHGGW